MREPGRLSRFLSAAFLNPDLSVPVCGKSLKIHVTFFVLLIFEVGASLRYVGDYPMYILLVFLLYGPILITTALVHECGHAFAARRLGGGHLNSDGEDGNVNHIVLWPPGGFAFAEPRPGGGPADDLKIALAGPLTHILMGLIWLVLYLATSGGTLDEFTFRTYLSVLSGDILGFCSTLFQQSLLLNILLLWLNIFVPAFPLDGGRIFASGMIMCGASPDKTALLSSFAAFLAGASLLGWSAVGFGDGFGITGVFVFLMAIFIIASSMNLFLAVSEQRVRQDPLFGRECYYVNGTTPPPTVEARLARFSEMVHNVETTGGRGDDAVTARTVAESDGIELSVRS